MAEDHTARSQLGALIPPFLVLLQNLFSMVEHDKSAITIQ